MNVGVLAMPMVPRWQVEALENVAAIDGVTLDYVVVDASIGAENRIAQGAEVIGTGRSISWDDVRLFTKVLKEDGLEALLYADEKLGWLVFGESQRMRYLRTTSLRSVDCFQDATIKEVVPERDGSWKEIPADVAAEVADRCDIVLRFGFGLVKGDILAAPKYGVLSTHGSDIRHYRGLGPRITFLRSEPMVTVTLQQLSETLNGGKIVEIASTPLPAPCTLDDVWGAVYDLQTEMYATGIRRFQQPRFEPLHTEQLGEYFSHDLMRTDVRFVSRLLAKNNVNRIRRAVS